MEMRIIKLNALNLLFCFRSDIIHAISYGVIPDPRVQSTMTANTVGSSLVTKLVVIPHAVEWPKSGELMLQFGEATLILMILRIIKEKDDYAVKTNQ